MNRKQPQEAALFIIKKRIDVFYLKGIIEEKLTERIEGVRSVNMKKTNILAREILNRPMQQLMRLFRVLSHCHIHCVSVRVFHHDATHRIRTNQIAANRCENGARRNLSELRRLSDSQEEEEDSENRREGEGRINNSSVKVEVK